MFRETLFFKTALYSAYDWLAKIRQLIFCRVPSALQLLSVSAFQNRSRGKSCVVERCASGTNPLSLAALDSSPEGRALGKEGKFRPHRSTAGRSLPLSCKLFALAKASPFRERWHGEAVTERVDPSFGPAERPSCSVKLRSCKKQERSTSRPRQNHNGRSIAGISPCQRETILLKRKKNALFYKMEKATYHSSQNEQKNLVHVHKKTTLV